MTKSNLNLQKAEEILKSWQRQDDYNKLVSVTMFNYMPQSKGFMLSLDVYIAGESENRHNGQTMNFFGDDLCSCVNQALDKLEEIREKMRNRL